MVNPVRLEAIAKLQQVILQTEEINEMLQKFLPEVLNQLSGLGFNYQFIATLFLDKNNRLNQSSMAYVLTSGGVQPIELRILNIQEIFNKDTNFEKELYSGGLVVINQTDKLISPISSPLSATKSIALVLVRASKDLWGVLVLASSRNSKDISDEEKQIIRLITNQIGLIYRLQETSNSLTNIGQEVYKMNFQLHELDKLKDEFVSLASHELRTPLTAISSYLYMVIYKSKDKLPDRTGRYLTRAFLSTERLISLVNDMLNVSRIESGRIEINPKSFELAQLVKEVVEEVKPKAVENKVNVFVLDNKPPQVFADLDKIHQVLLNLIGNALKFTRAGGNVTVSFFSDGKVVDAVIKDDGVGISKEEQGKLFQKFSRLDSSYLAMGTNGGTGLGLFISKRLVELMHGRIWVNSEGINHGSTFTFSLPVATPEIISQAKSFQIKPRDGGDAKGLEPVMI